MKLSWKQFNLELKYIFKIARGASLVEPIIILELEHDGIIGYGESSPISRYHESVETVSDFLKIVDLSRFESPFQLEEINRYLDSLGSGNTAARCAIDLALYDWVSKKLNLPLSKYLGIGNLPTPVSSFTIGIDTLEIIEKKFTKQKNIQS